MIIIVDYGMGNLGSVLNMFNKVGAKAKISSSVDEIKDAYKILLPGVGAFDTAMEKINNSGLREVLNEKALVDKIPILGICLGMQLLTTGSEEGQLPGFNWIHGYVKKFDVANLSNIKVPHMGWNNIKIDRKNELLNGLNDEARFYFVHSYYVLTSDINDAVASTYYGLWFNSVINNNNIWGAQFHPEKSHKYGMKLMKNFSEL